MKIIIPQIIVCGDKDFSWINSRKEKLIHEQNSIYNNCSKNNDTKIFQKLMILWRNIHLAMNESNDTCYSYVATKLVK